MSERNVMIALGTKLAPGGKKGINAIRKGVAGIGKLAKRALNFGKIIVAGAAIAAVALGKMAIEAASEFEEVSGKFDTVFKEQADSVREWSKEYSKAVGLSRKESLKFLASTQDLFVPLGFAREEAAGFSKQVVSLARDLASFNDQKTGDVVRDIQAALTGSAETMKKYGVVINQAKINQELLNMGIKDGSKKATDQQKAMAILQLVMAGTTDAQGDAVRTADSFANTMVRLRSWIDNVSVSIGQKLLPFMQPIVDKLASWIEANEELIASNIGGFVEDVAGQISAWAADGTFALWWERIKSVVFAVDLGIKSALLSWDNLKRSFSARGLLEAVVGLVPGGTTALNATAPRDATAAEEDFRASAGRFREQSQSTREAGFTRDTRQAVQRAKDKGNQRGGEINQVVDHAVQNYEQGLEDGLKRRNGALAAAAPIG